MELAIALMALTLVASTIALLGAFSQIGDLRGRLDHVERVWIVPTLTKTNEAQSSKPERT